MRSPPRKKLKLTLKLKTPGPAVPKLRGRGLFTLDLDLRQRIYDLALGSGTRRFSSDETTLTLQNRFAACRAVEPASKLTVSPRRDLGLLKVCRQLRREAGEVLWLGRVRLVVDHVVCDCELCGGFWGKKCYAWELNRDVLEALWLGTVKVLEVMTCEDCVVVRRRQPILPGMLPRLERVVLHEDCVVYVDLVGGKARERDVLGKLEGTGKYDGLLTGWLWDRENLFAGYKDLMGEIGERGEEGEFEVVVKVQAMVRYVVPQKEQFRFYFMRYEVNWDNRKIISRKGKDITTSRPDYDCQYKHDADNGGGIDNKRGCHGRAILPQDHKMEALPRF